MSTTSRIAPFFAEPVSISTGSPSLPRVGMRVPRRVGGLMYQMLQLRQFITDPQEQRSIATTLRRRRWAEFQRRFPDIGSMRVIDLGGTVVHWERSPVRPKSVTVVNLLPQTSRTGWITAIQGDACDPPAEIRAMEFDIVYSNSLIEHVGGHARRDDLASVIHGLAPRHWVQTPNRYFPIEPHYLFPGLQFLPQAARAKLIRRWPLSPSRPDKGQAVKDVLEIELLSQTEMRYHFPHSDLFKERVLGMTKSIVAVAS